MRRGKRAAVRVVLLLAVVPSMAVQEPDERAKRLAEFDQTHHLEQSKLYGALGEKGYLKNAEVVAGPPESASFRVLLDGKVSRLLYMPAQAGEPPPLSRPGTEGRRAAPRPPRPEPTPPCWPAWRRVCGRATRCAIPSPAPSTAPTPP